MKQNKLVWVSIISAIGLSGCQSLTPTPVAMNVGDVKGDKNVIIGHVEGDVTLNQGLSKAEVEKIVLAYLQANSAKIAAQKVDVAQVVQPIADTVTDLGKQGSAGKSAARELAKGNDEPAKAVLKQRVQQANISAQEQAKTYRNLGALAFLDNTQEALKNYRRATELDPDNADSWDHLGRLYTRTGELGQAIAAYQTELKLGQTHQNQQEIAAAYNNLGGVYRRRGELDKAIDMINKALAINEALGRKEGMAANYDNLGVVHSTRGELDKAVAMHNQALALNQALGRKEGIASCYTNLGIVYGIRNDLNKAAEMFNQALALDQALGSKADMASNYTNLGTVYKKKGNKVEAKRYYQKAIELFKYIGSPDAEIAQKVLDDLK